MILRLTGIRISAALLAILLMAARSWASADVYAPPATSPSAFKARDASGMYEVRLMKRYEGIYFPRLDLYRKGRDLFLFISGEGGSVGFSLGPGGSAARRVFSRPAPRYSLIPLGRGLHPGDKATYAFGQGNILQKTAAGCNDTDLNLLFIGRDGQDPDLELTGLGNISMYFLDMDADGRAELYLINAYYCLGVTELYRIRPK